MLLGIYIHFYGFVLLLSTCFCLFLFLCLLTLCMCVRGGGGVKIWTDSLKDVSVVVANSQVNELFIAAQINANVRIPILIS